MEDIDAGSTRSPPNEDESAPGGLKLGGELKVWSSIGGINGDACILCVPGRRWGAIPLINDRRLLFPNDGTCPGDEVPNPELIYPVPTGKLWDTKSDARGSKEVVAASRELRVRRSSSAGVSKSLRLEGKKSSACPASASRSSLFVSGNVILVVRHGEPVASWDVRASEFALKNNPCEPGWLKGLEPNPVAPVDSWLRTRDESECQPACKDSELDSKSFERVRADAAGPSLLILWLRFGMSMALEELGGIGADVVGATGGCKCAAERDVDCLSSGRDCASVWFELGAGAVGICDDEACPPAPAPAAAFDDALCCAERLFFRSILPRVSVSRCVHTYTHRLTRQNMCQCTAVPEAAAAFDVPLAHRFRLAFTWHRVGKRTRFTRGAAIITEELAWHLAQRLFFFRRQFGIGKRAACIRRGMPILIALIASSASTVFATAAAPTAPPAVRRL